MDRRGATAERMIFFTKNIKRMKQTDNFTRRTTAILTILITVLMCGAAAFAQTTAFTYQGKLTDGAMAASGTYDLGFALYDAETGGTQIGTTTTRPNVSVSGGIFTVQLDFGAAAFAAGANRFLQIAVKKTTETNFTTLTPRQPLTSSPYAIRTLNATAADALSTACVGCVTDAQINSIDGGKITGTVANATTATTAQNSEQLGGVAANNFVQSNSNAFVRNQTTAQTADLNINGTGSIGGNVGIGTTATTTEALRVVGSTGGDFGGAGKNISLQSGNGGAGFSGFGGGAGAIRLIGGNGGSGALGGAGAEILLQSGNGGITGGSGGAGITLQGGTGGNGNSVTNGGVGAGIKITAGNGGTADLSRSGGNGASITMQPGSGGIAERPQFNGVSGNIILAPTNGNVGIGTTNPTSKLFVSGDLTVTGTLNGTATNATNAVNAANAANADKLDNLDSTAFARTTDTTNFIRNQTTQQTGNFNVSGSGTIGGNLTVNGTLDASLGQSAATVFGTNSLTVGRTTVTSYTLVPGLQQTINAPEITDIFMSTDGGIRTLSTTSDGISIVDVAILLDGDIVTQRRYFIENDRAGQTNVNWSLSLARIVLVGSHTIEVRARSTTDDGLSNATVSSGSGDFMQGKLTVITIKR